MTKAWMTENMRLAETRSGAARALLANRERTNETTKKCKVQGGGCLPKLAVCCVARYHAMASFDLRKKLGHLPVGRWSTRSGGAKRRRKGALFTARLLGSFGAVQRQGVRRITFMRIVPSFSQPCSVKH